MPAFKPSDVSVDTWFESPRIQTLQTSESLGWESVQLSYASMIPGKDYAPLPRVNDYFIIAVMQGSARIKGRFNISPVSEGVLAPGDLQLVPPELEGVSKWEAPITAAFLQLSSQLPTKLGDGALRGDPKHVVLRPIFNFQDPLLFALTTALFEELSNANPGGELYAEAIAYTMILHLLRKYSNATLTSATPAASLSPAQVRLLDEYIHTHLDQKITLAALAGCLYMSVPHFERLFRASFGCAPYRYVLKRRIERAKRLLANTGFSLHEVARQSGFANQSHLTKHFTRFVGDSPSRYREQLKY